MYSPEIMEHFQNPRNVGEIPDADAIGTAGNPETGDIMKVYLRIVDGIIVEAKHKTFGNAVAIAASSRATEMIVNQPITEAKKISREAVSVALGGIPEDKMICSNMAPDAIRDAIRRYLTRS